MGVPGKGSGRRRARGKHHWSEDLKLFVDAPVEGAGEGRGAGRSQPLELRLERVRNRGV